MIVVEVVFAAGGKIVNRNLKKFAIESHKKAVIYIKNFLNPSVFHHIIENVFPVDLMKISFFPFSNLQLCEKFTAEKDNLKEEARNEIKNELQNINRDHEMEIQRIYSRVQQAIQKKDATLETLQKENAALRERNLKLDAIVRQQRKDYCTK